jgi:hypothetical protein
VQAEPLKPVLKALGTEVLILKCGEPLSSCAFKSILRRYREAELTHGRVAMLATVGIVVGEKVEVGTMRATSSDAHSSFSSFSSFSSSSSCS